MGYNTGNRKFGKFSDSLTISKTRGVLGGQAGGAFYPPKIVLGLYRYTRILVGKERAVYSVYLEGKKKFKGLALTMDGMVFTVCTLKTLNAVIGESKRNK
jgi:hypothetical protein